MSAVYWEFLSSDVLLPDGSPRLDSPIERAFYRCCRYLQTSLEGPPLFEIRSQEVFGKYRADFAFYDKAGKVLLVVECDGHDYHDGDKKAAARDKERDRWFASQGHTVFRFTGSEIYDFPFGPAAEAITFAIGKAKGG